MTWPVAPGDGTALRADSVDDAPSSGSAPSCVAARDDPVPTGWLVPPGRGPAAAEVELVEVTTTGDSLDTTPPAQLGGTGVLRQRAPRGSPRRAASTSPSTRSSYLLPTGAAQVASSSYPLREDLRDAVVAATGSHPRRSCRLGSNGRDRFSASGPRAARPRPGLEIVDIRGNVDPGSGRSARATTTPSSSPAPDSPGSAVSRRPPRCSTRSRCPRPGQAALAVETRDDDHAPEVAALDDARSREAVTAERAVLATLEGGRAAPVGALAEVVEGEHDEELWVRAVALSPDGTLAVRMSATATSRRRRRR